MNGKKLVDIRKYHDKTADYESLIREIKDMTEDMIDSFKEMIKAKTSALEWAIGELPTMLESAGLPRLRFSMADGLYPFLLEGFTETDDDEEDNSELEGLYPCFIAEEEVDGSQIALALSVNDDEDDDDEGTKQIGAFLMRFDSDGNTALFDGEEWSDLADLIEDDDEDE